MQNTLHGSVQLNIPPTFVTFRALLIALYDLHLGQKALIDRLHDVWKLGAPSPDSIVRDPKHYDERVRQAGNVEKRLLLPEPLAGWIEEASAARGMPLSARQAINLALGAADYQLEKKA